MHGECRCARDRDACECSRREFLNACEICCVDHDARAERCAFKEFARRNVVDAMGVADVPT